LRFGFQLRLPIEFVPVALYLPRVHSGQLIFLVLCLAGPLFPAQAVSARIIKVLPHYLDKAGRHALTPSLYERDAYQARLRKNPSDRTALRFDVQWKSREPAPLTLRVELRGAVGKASTTAKLEEPAIFHGLFSKWSSVTIKGDEYKKFGELTAWRATLWNGGQLVAEQKSFLW